MKTDGSFVFAKVQQSHFTFYRSKSGKWDAADHSMINHCAFWALASNLSKIYESFKIFIVNIQNSFSVRSSKVHDGYINIKASVVVWTLCRGTLSLRLSFD